MSAFKKHKRDPKKIDSGFISNSSRQGRRIAGESISELEGLDSSGPLEKRTTRQIGDFNQPNGYRVVRSTIDNQMSDITRPKPEPNESLLNKNLAVDDRKHSKREKDGEKKRHRLKPRKIAAITLSLVGIGVVAIAIFLVTKGVIDLRKIFGGNSGSIEASLSLDNLKVEGDGRINILLLGIGGQGHDGPDLTDTMLLVSIDPVNHTAGLLSIPRDMWINLSGFGDMKINAVYENGKWQYLGYESSSSQNHQAVYAGFNLDNKEVSNVLGIPIKYDVLLDFQAFQQIVDTLGGVTVNVPSELYDPTIAWQNNGNPVIALPGVQVMDGAKALLYVRSRETTSDFARTQRQRSVLLAIKSKALTLGTFSNPVKLSQLSDELGNNIVTNISLSNAAYLYSLVSRISNSNIQSIALADDPPNPQLVTTDTVGDQSVVRPTLGFNNYSAIQYFVRNILKDSYLLKENASIMVLNGSDQPNLGNQEASVLKSYGYNVSSVGNAPTNNYSSTQLVDLSGGKDPYTNHYLQLRLGVKSISQLPDNSIQPGNANFVIILGNNETINSSA